MTRTVRASRGQVVWDLWRQGARLSQIAGQVGVSKRTISRILKENGYARPTDEQRFASKYRLDHETGCWIWTAGRVRQNSKQGFYYGNFFWAGRNSYAHRFAYELYRGLIPSGLEIDHLCRQTLCVNPFHLEAVPHAVNFARGNRWPKRLTTADSVLVGATA